MTLSWFKLDHNIISDVKLRRFSPKEKWAWVVLLCLSSQSEDRGNISEDLEDVADICEYEKQDFLYLLDKFKTKGMVDYSQGGIRILNWDKHQHIKPSDRPEATRERKRQQRQRKRQKTEDVTPCHAPVTPLSRDVTLQTRLDQIRLEEKRSEEIQIRELDLTREEENFFSEVGSETEQENFQDIPANNQETRSQVEADRGYRTEIKNVPGAAASSTPAADVSGLTPSSSVDVFGRRFSSTAKVDPNYQRFKADYARLCRRNGIPFGVDWKVEAAWDERFPNGSAPEPQFWEGLQAFIELKDEQKQRDGRAIGVLGGVNFLLSDATAEALEMKQESEVNPTPTPAMSRTAAYEANLKAVMERTMPELERMYQEQLEIERRQGGSRWRSA